VHTKGSNHGCEPRSRLRRRSRGVSDLVAAILIVAIGVVLAAILFVLVSGLTSGPTTAPLGADFAWGQENNVTGSTIAGCGASGGATHAFCYTIAISVSSVSTSNFVVVLRNLTGISTVLPSGVAVSIDLVSPTVSSVGCAAPGTTAPGCVAYASAGFGSTWSNQGSFTGGVTSGFTLVIFSAGTATADGGMFGLVVSAVGTSGYSGNVIANAFL
jgi:FlaG/FlaF family flagellin (archaellin)